MYNTYIRWEVNDLEHIGEIGEDAGGEREHRAAGYHDAVQERLVVLQALHERLALQQALLMTIKNNKNADTKILNGSVFRF